MKRVLNGSAKNLSAYPKKILEMIDIYFSHQDKILLQEKKNQG